MLLLAWHKDLVMLTGAIDLLPILAGHPTLDIGHCAAYLVDLRMDMDAGTLMRS